MSTVFASFQTPIYFRIPVGIEGIGPTAGATVTASVQRHSDGYWLDWNPSPNAFVASPVTPQVAITEGDEPGMYEGEEDPWDWDTGSKPTTLGSYTVFYDVTAPASNIIQDADHLVIAPWLAGEKIDRDTDLTGDDVLGWQEVHTNELGREVARFNLFDQNLARITATPASFVAGSNMIIRRTHT